MSSEITALVEQMCSTVFEGYHPAYFLTDKLGNITIWGGDLAALNIKEPKEETPIHSTLSFMDGILPLKGQSMRFSAIENNAGLQMDAQLFKTEKGYGLIVWVAEPKDELFEKTQEKLDELSRLIEQQAQRLVPADADSMERAHNNFLTRLFQALNFVVLEMNHQGHFVLIGTPPPWIEQIPQATQIIPGQPYSEDVFGFLGHFIQETKNRWLNQKKGSFKSGIWSIKDEEGRELLFDATAVDIQGRKLLIISHDVCRPTA